MFIHILFFISFKTKQLAYQQKALGALWNDIFIGPLKQYASKLTD